MAARKRAALEVRKQQAKEKRQNDPNSAYSEDDTSDVEDGQKSKKKARTRKSEDNDTIDLASEHDGSFDVKQATKKAHDVAAGDKAILAPGWNLENNVEQKHTLLTTLT